MRHLEVLDECFALLFAAAGAPAEHAAVGAFAEQADVAVLVLDHDGHALAGRVKLVDGQRHPRLVPPLDADHQPARVATHKLVPCT